MATHKRLFLPSHVPPFLLFSSDLNYSLSLPSVLYYTLAHCSDSHVGLATRLVGHWWSSVHLHRMVCLRMSLCVLAQAWQWVGLWMLSSACAVCGVKLVFECLLPTFTMWYGCWQAHLCWSLSVLCSPQLLYVLPCSMVEGGTPDVVWVGCSVDVCYVHFIYEVIQLQHFSVRFCLDILVTVLLL